MRADDTQPFNVEANLSLARILSLGLCSKPVRVQFRRKSPIIRARSVLWRSARSST